MNIRSTWHECSIAMILNNKHIEMANSSMYTLQEVDDQLHYSWPLKKDKYDPPDPCLPIR